MLAVFLIALFGLVIIGVPIAFSLVGTGFFMMLTQAMSRPSAWSVFALAQKFVNGTDSVPLLAIPFFMIAGEIMTPRRHFPPDRRFRLLRAGPFQGRPGVCRHPGVHDFRGCVRLCGGRYDRGRLHDAADHGGRRL